MEQMTKIVPCGTVQHVTELISLKNLSENVAQLSSNISGLYSLIDYISSQISVLEIFTDKEALADVRSIATPFNKSI